MPDLPSLNDEILPFDSDAEKPKRPLILDDGELPYEVEVEKPKKRPPSRWWQKTYIPIPLLLAICVLLICSAVLLLGTSFTSGSLLCRIASFCSSQTGDEILSAIRNEPHLPYNQARTEHLYLFDTETNSNQFLDVTVTPARYSASLCDVNGDYRNHLMFTMESGDNTEIFISNPDGSALCRLTDNLIEEKDVDWSPDRKHILFVAQRSGDRATEIYEMNFDGTNIINLTHDPRNDLNGVWSPDGTQIAFSSLDQSGPGAQIYVVNADGSDRRNLTPDAVGAWTPTWSPDGTRIAYTAGTTTDPNNREIYSVEVATGNIQKLTNDVINAYSPVWSLDGSMLYFRGTLVSESGTFQNSGLLTLSLKDHQLQAFTAIPPSADNLVFSPDQTSIAFSVGYDLSIFDIQTTQIHALPVAHPVISRLSWR